MLEQANSKHILEGETVYLRGIEIEDADEYYKKLKDASFESEFLTGTKIIKTKAGLQGYMNHIVSDSNRLDFFIVSKDGDEIIGDVSVNGIDWTNSNANIRISIFDKINYNKGYGSEAMTIALNYGFGMHNLNRIELDVYSFNERALHVYEKIGFKKEGTLREKLYFNHKYYDAVVMSILKREFLEKQNVT